MAGFEVLSKGLVPAASSAPLLMPSPSSSAASQAGSFDLGVGDAVEHFPEHPIDVVVDGRARGRDRSNQDKNAQGKQSPEAMESHWLRIA